MANWRRPCSCRHKVPAEPTTRRARLLAAPLAMLAVACGHAGDAMQVGEGERAVPMARHPITFSATPGPVHAAAARAGRARRRTTAVAQGSRALVVNECPTAQYPTRSTRPLWEPRPATRSPCSATTWPATSWARSGSASWPSGSRRSAARSPARCGCSRRSSRRWPTTGSPPPRSSRA